MAKPKPLWSALDEIAERVEGAERLYVAADFDGTLAPIVSHPDRAVIPPRTRRALVALGGLTRVRIAVLSGRSLADLARRARLPGVFLSGVSGLETLSASGALRIHLPRGRGLPASLRPQVIAWCRAFRGAWVEDKRYAVALHYRAVAARRQPAFEAGVRLLVRRHPGVQLEHGKRVFDLRPAITWSKADALGVWLHGARAWFSPRVSRLPGRRASRKARALLVYVGDDTNDEPAYVWVRRRLGVSIAVGRRATRAEYGVASPRHVVWFLEWLAREWRAHHRS